MTLRAVDLIRFNIMDANSLRATYKNNFLFPVSGHKIQRHLHIVIHLTSLLSFGLAGISKYETTTVSADR